MTLPATGAITLNNVNTELARSSGASINMNDATLRVLFGKDTLASQISMSDGYSKNYPLRSFRGYTQSGADGTTYTFNNVDIGTPTSDRYVAVWTTGTSTFPTLSTRTVVSISIAGTNGTIVSKNQAKYYPRACAIRNVTTGTTATITVTFSAAAVSGAASVRNCLIAVYAIYGVSSTTVRDNELNDSTAATTLALTVGDATAPVAGDISLVHAGSLSSTRVQTVSGGSPAIAEDGEVASVESDWRVSHHSVILTGTASQTYTLSNGGLDGKLIEAVILRGYNT